MKEKVIAKGMKITGATIALPITIISDIFTTVKYVISNEDDEWFFDKFNEIKSIIKE